MKSSFDNTYGNLLQMFQKCPLNNQKRSVSVDKKNIADGSCGNFECGFDNPTGKV